MLLRRFMMRAAPCTPPSIRHASATMTRAVRIQAAVDPRSTTTQRRIHVQPVSASVTSPPSAVDGSARVAVTAPGDDEYAQLESQFLRHVPVVDGMDAMQQLKQMAAAADAPASAPAAASSSSPPGPAASSLTSASASSSLPRLIVIGGDQCTGKSTLSGRLAELIGGRAFSAGTIFRATAKRMGLSSAELSRRALADPGIDVGIEFDLCRLLLSRGLGPEGALVIEGRQPAVMAGFLRRRFGRSPDFTVRLVCSTREQALRFIQREAGDKLFHMAAKVLPDPLQSLSAASPMLRALGASLREDDAASSKLQSAADRLCAMFSDNDRRDEDDRRRFLTLYGKGPRLDYRSPELYDAIIDTTPNQPQQTFAQTVQAMETHLAAKQKDATRGDSSSSTAAASTKGIRSKL